MFSNIKWLFFDVGSTLIDETEAYRRRFEDIASFSGVPYREVIRRAEQLYKQRKKGDTEVARELGLPLPKWYTEAERPYSYTLQCLQTLSKKYKIGIIANQLPGTKDRLEKFGLSSYVDLTVASAEEERREIENIRRQYSDNSAEQNGLNRLRALDRKVKTTPKILAVTLGIVGILIFGLGLTMILEWSIIVWGIAVSAAGCVPMSISYPIYKYVLKRNKEKYGDEILKLSETLLNENKDGR